MAIKLQAKLPSEVRNDQHSWAGFLGADTIQSQTTVGTGVTVDSSSVDPGGQSITFFYSGGVDGTIATIDQSIVSVGGLTDTQTFSIRTGGDEPISLDEAKAYLRVRHTDEDAKIA